MRTPDRHDWSLKPKQPNYLTLVREAGKQVHAVGKIRDIFAGVDIDESHPTRSNVEGINQTERLLNELDEGLVFTNLVETDMLWGHRNDPVNFHRCLQDFDRRLPDLLAALRDGRPPDPDVRPRLRPNDSVDRPLAGARAAARLRRGSKRGGTHSRGRVRRRRRDRQRLARRQGAATGDSRRVDRRALVPIRPAELIERKRDGGRLTPDEITELVLGHARGEIPDYQLAAFCMAVYFKGLTAEETLALTDAFVRSGSTLDLKSELGRTVVDKHSTGGVGDKTSIVVGPLVAACGVPFGKMSGRGLGHTGGTLDKLESIPGFRVELSNEEFVAQVRDVGLAIIGQSPDLVPADKRLYALRDVTATVDSIPLIAASIMSKKIAAGAEAIVLDVKVGDGAFMKSLEDARMLAEAMLELGRGADRNVVALLTDMDQPLGWAIGNAIEIEEARTLLSGGESPPDLFSLAIQAAGRLLSLSDLGIDADEGAKRAEAAIDDGSALEAYERWITPRAATRPSTCFRRHRSRKS